MRPRARPGIELAGDALVVRVGAPPEGGKATEEARRVLAAAVGVPRARVRLVTGARSRVKVFEIDGPGPAAVARALSAAAGG